MFWELPGFRKSHARTHCTPKALPATRMFGPEALTPLTSRVSISRVAGVTGAGYGPAAVGDPSNLLT